MPNEKFPSRTKNNDSDCILVGHAALPARGLAGDQGRAAVWNTRPGRTNLALELIDEPALGVIGHGQHVALSGTQAEVVGGSILVGGRHLPLQSLLAFEPSLTRQYSYSSFYIRVLQADPS